MKTIKIANKEYIFAELAPNQSWNPEFPGFLTWEIPDIGTYSEPYIMPIFDLDSWRKDTKIITTTNSITEEVAEIVVLCTDEKSHKLFGDSKFKNYFSEYPYYHKTALESFYSLMDSLGLDRSKNYLLIEKL